MSEFEPSPPQAGDPSPPQPDDRWAEYELVHALTRELGLFADETDGYDRVLLDTPLGLQLLRVAPLLTPRLSSTLRAFCSEWEASGIAVAVRVPPDVCEWQGEPVRGLLAAYVTGGEDSVGVLHPAADRLSRARLFLLANPDDKLYGARDGGHWWLADELREALA